ncbi:RNA polymerase II degradation factor 1 [Euphorbia lathyris]|uniref:RNA polymerase II degradation factor 1 n=1 Tax=Euphorbia lathyris TaxID=212925 RepID=UPI0033144CD6
MATKANTSVARKDKKTTPATPLSNSRSKPTNNVVGAVPTVASKVKTTTSSPLAKPVPNYLRHTTSSSKSDSLAPVKKTINEDLAHNVARRRSFDKPPSAIRTHKSLISPDPKDRVLSRERHLATRSSSFSPSSSSSKVLGSPKPILERNAKSLKPIRPQAISVKRSSSFSKPANSPRNGISIPSPHSTKSPSNGNVEETKQQLETKDQSSHVEEAKSEDVDMQKDEIKEDIVVDYVQGGENTIDGAATEENNEVIDTFVKLKLIEESSELLDKNYEDEISHTIEEEEEKNQDKEESNNNTINQPQEERIADDAPEIETEEEEKVNEVSAEEVEEEAEKKKNEETEEISVHSKELENIVVKVDEKIEEKEGSSHGGQKGQGKRESPVAYNDVIEETKNKLMEKRKNKVKALVGAFQTVIDYETPTSNK